MLRADAIRPYDVLIIGGAAVTMAFSLVWMRPGTGLLICAGLLVLIIAFVSARAALYLLIFAMLLSPELPLGMVQGRGVGGRAISIRLDDMLLIVIGLAWLVKTVVFRELSLIKFTALNRPILYYMLVCVVSTLLGVITGRVQPVTGFFFVLKYFEYFFIFFMVVNNVASREQMVPLVGAVFFTCVVISLYAIYQIPSGQRATAPFEGESGEPNTLGGYLVFIMAMATGLLLHVPGRTLRLALVGLLGLCTLALMATLSRSSYLAAAALGGTVLLTQWRRPAILMIFLLVLLTVPLLAPENVKHRVTDTFFGQKYGGELTVAGVTVDLSTTERLRSWHYVLQDWRKRPLLGYGVTGYAWADAQYVKILGETGLAGLCAFLFLMYRLWGQARESYRDAEDPFAKGLSLGLLLGLAAMLVHALGANTFIIIRIMEPFWLCAGLVILLPTLRAGPSRTLAGPAHP